MYEYINGIFVGINKDYVVIDNNGIGYRIYTSGSTIAKMPKKDEKVILYTQQIVREDFIGLYGFLTKEELSMFNLFLTINGVGAKAALSLLSISTVNNLKLAITLGNLKLITRAPGIGKKIAQRIILELKDKVQCDDVHMDSNSGIMNTDNAKKINEALDALISLGYSDREAHKVLESINVDEPLESIIKNCLKSLMK